MVYLSAKIFQDRQIFMQMKTYNKAQDFIGF